MSHDRVTLNELDMDTAKTTAKAIGSRVRDAATATAGSFVGRGGEAQGRLGVRIAADHMLQGWLKYKGATGVQGTRSDLYQFLRRHYGNIIDDATMRGIIGMSPPPPTAPIQQQPAAPPPTAPTAPTAPTGPTVSPTAPTQQQPAAPPPPTAPTVSPTPRRSTAGAASKQDASASPWQTNPTTGVKYRPVTPPAAAPAPPGAATWEPPDNPDPLPQAGAQPAAPAADATDGVAFMITNAQKQSLRAAGFTDEQIANMTPQQAQQNLAGQPKTANSQRTTPPAAPAGVNWGEFHTQLESLIKQPQTDGEAVMQLLATTLKQTQKDTPERAKMVNLLRAFQQNPQLAAKVPQIKQISLESRRRNGTLLREADNDVLPRSALDQIFVKTAQTLVASGKLPSEDQQQQQQRNTGQQPAANGTAETLDTYKNNLIKRDAWDRAAGRDGDKIAPNQRKDYRIISNKLDELLKSKKLVTLHTLMKALIKDHKNFFDNLSHSAPDVEHALIQAAKADQ